MWARLVVYGVVMLGLTSCVCPPIALGLEPSPSPGDVVKNVPVVVANRDIPACARLDSTQVQIQYFSADQAPPFAFRSIEIVVGKYAVIPIHAGQAITDNVILTVRSSCPSP